MSDVFFPIVGCGQSRMATVRCDCLDAKDYPAGRALVLARDEQEIERILADARSTEATGAEIVRPIWVRFTPQQFTGRSYGLALALADKLARYRRGGGAGETRIFATGIVIEDAAGKIGKVDSLEDKLAAIAEEAGRGDILVLPKANLEKPSAAEQALLDRLDRQGVVRREAETLDQLVDLYGLSSAEDDQTPLDEGNAEPGRAAADTGLSAGEEKREILEESVAKADRSSARGLGRFAVTVVALLVTGAAAFVAGDWSRHRSLVASHANEARPTDETASVNLLENASFEAGEGQHPAGWTTYSRGKHDHADWVRPGGIDGDLVLEQSSDEAFYVDTHQVLAVEDGFYALSAWVTSNGDRKAHRMRARGDEPVEIDIPATAPESYRQMNIHCIEATKGRLAVGFYLDAYKGSSAAYDKVELVENPRAADGRACVELAASAQSSADEPSVTEVAGENLITNPSFEQGKDQDPIGWETFSRGKHDDADRVQSGGMHGSLTLEHGSDDAFYVDTYQIIPVANGYYSLSAWVHSDREKKANRMYARAGDADLFEADIPITGGDYRQVRIDCIQATEERLVVGFYTDSHEGGLTAYDDVRLQSSDQTVDGRPC